jgi:uncharacterized membrane protein
MLKLIGILIVAIGFGLRINTLLVVMVAGIATGLAAGLSLTDILSKFGEVFITNRYMSLFILTLPVIGLLENRGLKEQAEKLILRAKKATTGRILLLYLFIRELSAALGLNIGGHPQTVRPLVAPMAESAASVKLDGEVPEGLRHKIRAHAAAAENVGWFFGEDIFIATGAILLMKGFYDSVGLNVGVWDMALWGIPTAVAAFCLMWWRVHKLDREIQLLAARNWAPDSLPRGQTETAKNEPM